MLPFRPKSLEALRLGHTDPVETTVYEGAIRSSKTITSLFDWDNYILHCKEKAFLMSGNTLGSLSRNCLEGEYGFLAMTGAKPARDFDGSHILRYAGKTIYLMGGHDASSFKKARGLSIGGAYLDEANLQDRVFVETILGRSFASSWIRNIITINPDVPNHWFYKDKTLGIDRFGTDYVENLYRRFHFTLDDNPAITEERKARIAAQYSGVFYQRYILGLRVRAEGGCFPGFDQARNVIDAEPEGIRFVIVGVDIGKSRSATTASAVGFFWSKELHRLCLVVLDELYYKDNASSEAVISKIADFIRSVRARWTCADVYVDSEEQLVIKSLRAMGIANINGSIKKRITDRIRFWDVMFATGRAFIMRHCKHNIEATESAVWNSKVSDKEERLDDGSTDIDTLDAREYAAEPHMSDMIA